MSNTKIPKFYRLLSETRTYPKGSICTFETKHLITSNLSFQEQREVKWEEISFEEARKHNSMMVYSDDVYGDGTKTYH